MSRPGRLDRGGSGQGRERDWEGQPSWASVRRTSTEAPAFPSLFTVDSLQVSGRSSIVSDQIHTRVAGLGTAGFAAAFTGWLWRKKVGPALLQKPSDAWPPCLILCHGSFQSSGSSREPRQDKPYKRTARYSREEYWELLCPVMEELGHPEKSSNFPQFTWKVFSSQISVLWIPPCLSGSIVIQNSSYL